MEDNNNLVQGALTRLWLSIEKAVEIVRGNRDQNMVSHLCVEAKKELSQVLRLHKGAEAVALKNAGHKLMFLLIKEVTERDSDLLTEIEENEEKFAQQFEAFYYAVCPKNDVEYIEEEDELVEEVPKIVNSETNNKQSTISLAHHTKIREPHIGLGSLRRRNSKARVPLLLKTGWMQSNKPTAPTQVKKKAEWKIVTKKEKGDSRKPRIPMGTFRLTKKPALERKLSVFVQISSTKFDVNQYETAKQFIMDGHEAKFLQAIKGIDINMQDPHDYNTLLHWAVAYNEIEMARALLARGIKQLKNGVGLSPLDLALQAYNSGDSSFWEIKNLLSGKDVAFLKE